jgi:hypothetical protein
LYVRSDTVSRGSTSSSGKRESKSTPSNFGSDIVPDQRKVHCGDGIESQPDERVGRARLVATVVGAAGAEEVPDDVVVIVDFAALAAARAMTAKMAVTAMKTENTVVTMHPVPVPLLGWRGGITGAMAGAIAYWGRNGGGFPTGGDAGDSESSSPLKLL